LTPRKEQDRPAEKRLRWLVGAGALVWLVLAGRLVQVQGFRHQDLLAQAREQHLRRVELKATRGSILDRRGSELAVDIQYTSFYATPALVEEPGRVAAHFAPLSRQSAPALEHQLRSGRPFVYLARQVSDEALPQVNRLHFAGVFQHPETRRYYPLGPVAGQVLGHVNIDHQGSEGAELAFDQILREEEVAVLSYVDARGQPVPGAQPEQRRPADGRSLMLTIDAVYQGILEEELRRAIGNSGAEGGTGLITDPHTGEILAMANLPSCDPNQPGQASPRWRRNRAITDAYEPGSTFKMIAAAAALEDGLARPEERLFCENGRLQLPNGEIIRDAHPYGELSFQEIVAHSSNIGLIKIAQRLPRRRFYEYIRRFGFGTRSGIGLPAESGGLLRAAEEWSERSLETIAIGQEISVTPLQLAQAYGVVANGGLLMAPQIVKAVLGSDGQVEERLKPQVVRRLIGEPTAARLREMLAKAVASGTGQRAQIEGVAVAGKTGTAQRAAADGRGYEPGVCIVSFVGFLPAERPQLLCLVVIENPQKDKWGGQLAAPVFQRAMQRILYLPGGLLAQREPRVEEALPLLVEVPDLRGMSPPVARFQAGLRGLKIYFEGRGEVVIAQQVLSADGGEGPHIACALGSSADLQTTDVEGLPRRQARLLQSMQPALPARGS
jgi:cell division protein FtsI (penicillin-binding protein 3)